MPLYWGNNAQGTIPTSGMVPTWCCPTNATTPIYLSSWLYTANQTQLGTQAATTGYFGVTDHTHTIWFLGDDVNSAQYYALAQNRVAAYQERTEAERLAQEEQARRYRAQHEERMRQHEAAVARSRELLLEHLTPAQRETFEKHKWFVIEGGKTRSKYRIRTESYAGNIDVMEGSKAIARLCVHCDGVPLHDHHLAQKLMLEHDEERVLKVANRTRVA